MTVGTHPKKCSVIHPLSIKSIKMAAMKSGINLYGSHFDTYDDNVAQ